MNILLKQVTIADPNSPFNGAVKDILIENGIIKQIADSVTTDNEVIELTGFIVSPGWVDIFSHFCDPGFEYRETLETGAAAAAAGGYTQVFALPNTNPAVQNKPQVEYIVQKSKPLPVTIHPLGAVTKGIEGKDLAEMYDMHDGGAIAFSDGTTPVQSAGLMVKALQYVKPFNGVIIQLPQDKSLGQHGLMNEGITSTRLGLPGIPAIAEELIIRRDIELLAYAGSKLHITGVSTEKGLQLIQSAKDAGLDITCSVTPYHLFFCDEDLQTYDTNLKVNPPLRTKQDMLALREGVKNGWVDCIASHHIPQNWDGKTCEFEYAKNGMIGLQTAFAVVNTAIPGLMADKIAGLFSLNARRIFNLPVPAIEEGAVAELTFYNAQETFVLQKQNILSKSQNTPFIQVPLTGKVVGIAAKGITVLNK
jgi:dihydroorotase